MPARTPAVAQPPHPAYQGQVYQPPQPNPQQQFQPPAATQYPGYPQQQQQQFQPPAVPAHYQSPTQQQYQPPAVTPAETFQSPPPLPNVSRPIPHIPNSQIPHPTLPPRNIRAAQPTPQPTAHPTASVASLPDPSSFPAPPSLYKGPEHSVPGLPPRSTTVTPLPTRAVTNLTPPPSTPAIIPAPVPISTLAPAPAPVVIPIAPQTGKKKPPPAPPKNSKPKTFGANTSVATQPAEPTITHDDASPPYSHETRATEEPASPPKAGGAARLAKQFEQMNLNMVAELNRRNNPVSTRSPVSSASLSHVSSAGDNSTQAHGPVSAAHKKPPPAPPKKGNLAGHKLNASSHHGPHVAETAASIASVVAASQAGAPQPAHQAAVTPDHEIPSTPPPINYATRPDLGSSAVSSVPTPATAPAPITQAYTAAPSQPQALGSNKNDPQGQYDLNLNTLWFTQSARSMQLPPTLQDLNYIFSVASASAKRTLILALRVSETLAIVKFKLEWQASDPLGTVTVARQDVPPPPSLTQQQLAQARDQFGNSVASYAESVSNTQVGDGECWTLGKQALEATPGTMPPQGCTFGAVVYEAEGMAPAPVAYNDRIARGDIIQFLSARIETKSPQGVITRQVMLGAPNHTSVITNVSADNRTVDVLHQNVGGMRTVQPGSFNLDDVTAGHVTVYRPIWKEWAGDLEASWK